MRQVPERYAVWPPLVRSWPYFRWCSQVAVLKLLDASRVLWAPPLAATRSILFGVKPNRPSNETHPAPCISTRVNRVVDLESRARVEMKSPHRSSTLPSQSSQQPCASWARSFCAYWLELALRTRFRQSRIWHGAAWTVNGAADDSSGRHGCVHEGAIPDVNTADHLIPLPTNGHAALSAHSTGKLRNQPGEFDNAIAQALYSPVERPRALQQTSVAVATLVRPTCKSRGRSSS